VTGRQVCAVEDCDGTIWLDGQCRSHHNQKTGTSHQDPICCQFGRAPGPTSAAKVSLCDDHRAQLEDFRQWLQQFRGKYVVLVEP
jgi:hypothetical protein